MYREIKRALRLARKKRRPFFKNYSKILPIDIANSRCAISTKSKFMCFRIPKAANTTIIASLYFGEHGNTLTDAEAMKEIYIKPMALTKKQTIEAMSYFKFAVVRNPFDRAVSGYLDKIVLNKAQKKKVTDFKKKEFHSDVTMDEFIDYLEYGRGIYENAHWALQTDLIFLSIDKLDYLGRFENLEEDLTKILETIYGSSKIITRASHSTREQKNLFSLTENQKKRLFRIYEKDFDLLEYSKL